MPPVYEYLCTICQEPAERICLMDERDKQLCSCGAKLDRQQGAPLFRFKGVVTKGGGPDKFTADMLGIPLKELPSGLRTDGGRP